MNLVMLKGDLSNVLGTALNVSQGQMCVHTEMTVQDMEMINALYMETLLSNLGLLEYIVHKDYQAVELYVLCTIILNLNVFGNTQMSAMVTLIV